MPAEHEKRMVFRQSDKPSRPVSSWSFLFPSISGQGRRFETNNILFYFSLKEKGEGRGLSHLWRHTHLWSQPSIDERVPASSSRLPASRRLPSTYISTRRCVRARVQHKYKGTFVRMRVDPLPHTHTQTHAFTYFARSLSLHNRIPTAPRLPTASSSRFAR